MHVVCRAARDKMVRTLNEAKLFTVELHKNWKLGHCHEDVIILYSHDDDVVGSHLLTASLSTG